MLINHYKIPKNKQKVYAQLDNMAANCYSYNSLTNEKVRQEDLFKLHEERIIPKALEPTLTIPQKWCDSHQ